MCCIIALSVLYTTYRIQENKRIKQRNLKDPVLFYVDLMMREDRPMEEILSGAAKTFTLEQIALGERRLVSVMKGEKKREAPCDGDDGDQRRRAADECVKRIAWLLATVRRNHFRDRYRCISVNVDSRDVAHFVGFKWYPLGLVPQMQVESASQKPALELADRAPQLADIAARG